MSQMEEQKIKEIAAAFHLPEPVIGVTTCGGGHINRTWRITCGSEGRRFILQQINTEVFREPDVLMENISRVTGYLRQRVVESGGDPDREVLNFRQTTRGSLLQTTRGSLLYRDESGCCWRAMDYVKGAVSYEQVTSPVLFYESGRAFGRFQRQLAEFPAEELMETIPDFHHTPKRYEQFCRALQADVCGRVAEVQPEITFLRERAERMGRLQSLRDRGLLPARVTHNDTKLSNVMLDEVTGKAVCVIDLDTVMPGLAVLDYGDSLRFGACTAAEDETDLSKVSFSLPLMEAYTRGFLEECGASLTEEELALLPEGAWTITMEQGMRFLTDYLEGDVYYQIRRNRHNLDRARVQFALAADMEQKWDEMKRIVEKYR